MFEAITAKAQLVFWRSLAALTGDRAGAIRAYRHYLDLRGEAEPALQPQGRQVRAELEALERESTDR
jgi:hypothetical protein